MEVWYHGNCPDGFGAALAVWNKYGEKYKYIPVFHGEKAPEPNKELLIILDFCYSYEEMVVLSKKVNKLILIDHHNGMSDVIEKLKNINNIGYP